MVPKKTIVINFDTEVVDGKSVLEAFRAILGSAPVQAIYRGKTVNLSDILRDEQRPDFGFQERVLPDHIKNVSVLEENDFGELRIALSYVGQFNHETERKYWEAKGYTTEPVDRSLAVRDSQGNLLAMYGINRVLIEGERLNEFIEKMR